MLARMLVSSLRRGAPRHGRLSAKLLVVHVVGDLLWIDDVSQHACFIGNAQVTDIAGRAQSLACLLACRCSVRVGLLGVREGEREGVGSAPPRQTGEIGP